MMIVNHDDFSYSYTYVPMVTDYQGRPNYSFSIQTMLAMYVSIVESELLPGFAASSND